jgi:hypothetical protein
MLEIRTIIDLLRERSPTEKAKICAYLLAPGFVLGITISGILGGNLAINPAPVMGIAELKTEILRTGTATTKEGFALIIEPTASEFRMQLSSQPAGAWSSFDESAARANRDRLTLDQSGIYAKPPFLGIDGPVMVIIEGQLGSNIQVPGGERKVGEFLLRAKRSDSIVSSVLIACIFAFGMSSAQSFRSTNRHKNAAG